MVRRPPPSLLFFWLGREAHRAVAELGYERVMKRYPKIMARLAEDD